ncbi:hypothetical protein KP509_33G037000 [Ceratopteris richardii]|uniref:Uncharacterized protein n=1 Tax=Ceratopteris richardii TaxID=49495 RepID=A0A8T2QPV3_CERRI|nr:hypothetical protein KP509_33G037000 [Ceratopteris richardii]
MMHHKCRGRFVMHLKDEKSLTRILIRWVLTRTALGGDCVNPSVSRRTAIFLFCSYLTQSTRFVLTSQRRLHIGMLITFHNTNNQVSQSSVNRNENNQVSNSLPFCVAIMGSGTFATCMFDYIVGCPYHPSAQAHHITSPLY